MNDQADTANGGGKIINEGDLKEIRIEKDELKQKWGKEYKQNMEMVYQAVKDTMGQVIVYDGRLIIPVSHAVSIGVTVSAEELYGTAIPYLVSVDSSQDIQSPEFSSTKIYSALRIKKEFGMNGEGKAFDGSENLGQTGVDGEKNKSETAGSAQNEEQAVDADALTVLEATKSGFVRKVNVFGTVVTGETFAQTLSLGTTNFHIDQVEEGYRIISIGKGSSLECRCTEPDGKPIRAVHIVRSSHIITRKLRSQMGRHIKYPRKHIRIITNILRIFESIQMELQKWLLCKSFHFAGGRIRQNA